ncbi:FliM/FliN family flagellar motor switch protein [Rhizobium helianthi]|uniref:FliM/FliN family flagellar motor switch protein n=1 Tax=Rhizobium helianthi TaxID=1132695 RepID=A0ABW4M7X8_9HYPH
MIDSRFAQSLLTFDAPPLPLDRPLVRRQAESIRVRDDEVRIRPLRAIQRTPHESPSVILRLQAGEENARILIESRVVHLLCTQIQPGLDFYALTDAAQISVLEYLFDQLLTEIEQRSATPISLLALEPFNSLGFTENFAFEIDYAGTLFQIGAEFGRQHLYRLWNWAIALPREALPELPMDIALRCGTASLSAEQLRGIRVGDGIVVSAASDEEWYAVTAERYVAPLRRNKDQLVLEAPLLTEPTGPMRQLMDDFNDDEMGEGPLHQGSVEDIPIKVVFNAGRVTLPLSELETVDVGYVFQLDQRPRTAVEIVAQGTVIGRGEIISVEGLTAVRVTALNVRS